MGRGEAQLVDGTIRSCTRRPVRRELFESALFLGSSAEQGVGCDDTSGPNVEVRPAVRTIPSDPAEAAPCFRGSPSRGAGVSFSGPSSTAPPPPTLKTSWTEPISVSADWRDRSYAVPAGGALGTQTTDFFCGAIAAGSNALRRLVDDPVPLLLALGTLLVLVLVGLSRAAWRPTAPLHLARRRAWGQIFTAASRMLARRLWLFLGIGLVLLPISFVVTLLQAIVIRASSIAGISTDGEGGGVFVFLVFVIGTALTLLGLSLVVAATARALVEIENGRPIGPFGAYRLAFERRGHVPRGGDHRRNGLAPPQLRRARPDRRLAGGPLGAGGVRGRIEGRSATDALRRSGRLVRRQWLKVASYAVFGAALALMLGPLVGALHDPPDECSARDAQPGRGSR